MTKRTLVPVERLSDETQSFYDVLNNESDLPAVLITASYIDACLGAILKKFFLDNSTSANLLNPKVGSLGTFGSRSDACYCLGLIDKRIYQDLLVIAEIRNLFAHHHLALSFAVPEVAQQCERLSYVAQQRNGNTDVPLLDAKHLRTPRDRFVISAVIISQRLLLTGLGISRVQTQLA